MKHPQQSSLPSTVDFDVEALEARSMLAGNVAVELNSAGDIVVTGDNESNSISIQCICGNANSPHLRVFSSDSTTSINNILPEEGYSGNVPIDVSSLRDLKIKMRGGTDRFSISDASGMRNVSVSMGSGNDRFDLTRGDLSGNVKVRLGSGETGVGHESLINFDQGVFFLGSSIDGNVIVRGSRTHDVVSNSAEVGGRISVVLGSGDDGVSFSGNSELPSTAIAGKVSIKLGSGDDYLSLRSFRFEEQFRADGATGNDALYNTSSVFQVPATFNGFEEL